MSKKRASEQATDEKAGAARGEQAGEAQGVLAWFAVDIYEGGRLPVVLLSRRTSGCLAERR